MSTTSVSNENAIMLVSFPHQLLHALSALKYERLLSGKREHAPATILVWTYHSEHHAPGSIYRKIFDCLLHEFPYVTLVFPGTLERCFQLSPYRTISDRIKWLGNIFSRESFGSVFFPHDASADQTAQVLMQLFPDAKRVCYGDPPGFLYPPYSANQGGHSTKGVLKRLFWQSRLHRLKKLYKPATSIIAVDFREHDQLSFTEEVRILPRAILLETLRQIEEGIRVLLSESYVRLMTTELASEGPYLLLMSNFSESRMMSPKNEIAMYFEICSRYVPAGRKVLIKTHSGAKRNSGSELVSRLSASAFEAELLPVTTQHLPIELLPELISRCNIVSVSSASSLISYLFNTEVIHALSADIIRKYFKDSSVEYMVDANNRIRNNIQYLSSLVTMSNT